MVGSKKVFLALCLMTFFVNVSFVMVYGLSAIYMKTIVGLSALNIGFIAGMAEAFSYAVKLVSGVVSDRFQARKPLVVIGLVGVFISRPILAFFPNFLGVVSARFLERIGNGLQATPIEAWICDLTTFDKRALYFSIKRSIGFFGSFVGAVAVSYFMTSYNQDFKLIFILAGVPVFISLVSVVFFTKDVEASWKADKPLSFKNMLQEAKLFPKKYYMVLALASIISFLRSLETFVPLLGIEKFSLTASDMGYVYMILYATISLISLMAARCYHYIGSKKTFFLGMFILSVACFLFSYSKTTPLFWAALVFWGGYQGILQTLFLILIASLTPASLKGSAFGLYYLVCALFLGFGSIISGLLVDLLSYDSVFYSYCLISFLVLLCLIPLRFDDVPVTKKQS